MRRVIGARPASFLPLVKLWDLGLALLVGDLLDPFPQSAASDQTIKRSRVNLHAPLAYHEATARPQTPAPPQAARRYYCLILLSPTEHAYPPPIMCTLHDYYPPEVLR